MATTGLMNGTDVIMYIDGVAIANSTNNSLSWSMEGREATTKDSGGHSEMLEGLRSWEMGVEAFEALDATKSFEELFDLINTRDKISVVLSTKISGDVQYFGAAFVTNIEQTSGVEETITFSASLTGTGALKKANVT